MAEAAVAEEVVSQDSEVLQPASETVIDTPSIEEERPDGTGAGPSDTGEGETPTEPVAEKSPEERYAELREKKNREGLTPAEGVEYDRVEQSVNDRKAHEQKRIAELQAREQQVAKAVTELGSSFKKRWFEIEAAEQALADEEGRAISPRNIDREHDELINQLLSRVEYIGAWQPNVEINQRIRGAEPPSAKLEEFLASATLMEKVDRLIAIPRAPSADHTVTKASEWEDGQHIPSRQKAIDDMKAANPSLKVITDDGVRGSGTGLPSRQQWIDGTYQQREAWRKQYGDDVSDRIFG